MMDSGGVVGGCVVAGGGHWVDMGTGGFFLAVRTPFFASTLAVGIS